MRDPTERLRDILEAIERIEERCGGARNAFDADEMLQIWVVHHLQIIGEAGRALPDEFRQKYPSLPWVKIIGMRHILVHHYFDVDLEVVWSVVERELPEMKARVAALLAQLEHNAKE